MAAEDSPATAPTTVPVEAFLETVAEPRRTESQTLVQLMREVTGHEPVMWGPSIVGFDAYHYGYATGREGDSAALAFSPRKGALTIHVVEGFDRHGEALEQSHRTVKDELDTVG
jgi:hypothetical protein